MENPTFNFRCLAYQEKDSSFTGVCLDLDIVEEKHQTLQEAILSINDAVRSHMLVAAEEGYPQELLSRPAPKMYWEKLGKLASRAKKPQKLPIEMFQFFPAFAEKVPAYA